MHSVPFESALGGYCMRTGVPASHACGRPLRAACDTLIPARSTCIVHVVAGVNGPGLVRPLGYLHPLNDMAGYLAGRFGASGTDKGRLEFVAAGRHRHVVRGCNFAEIPDTDEPRRIAFVDGGNATLAEAPSFLIGMNRVYYSLFRGDQRQKPTMQPRIEFFSCVTTRPTTHSSTTADARNADYTTLLFAHNDADTGRIPRLFELDVSGDAGGRDTSRDSLLAMVRELAEWAAVEFAIDNELNEGDMVVMDGTLRTGSMRETKFAEPVREKAIEKGVVLCGLAKTSTLVTADGLSLIGRASELANAAGLSDKRWFVGVCDHATANDMGYTYIAKFHERSRHVFRFGILGKQHEMMSGDEVKSVLASIAANSCDISIPGYPYGAIDADRFAKVRMREAAMHRNMLDADLAGMDGGEAVASQIRSMSIHRDLNRVTG